MDEFEKIKTFSESLAEREQKITQPADQKKEDGIDLPQYLSQFRTEPAEEEKESKSFVWIILGAAAVIVSGVVVALSFRVPEMEESEIVVISPTPIPVKIRPENPGGLNIPDTDKVVYHRVAEGAPEPVAETLFPEQEQPVMPTEVIEPEIKEEALIDMEVAPEAPEVVASVEPVAEVQEETERVEQVVESEKPAKEEPKKVEIAAIPPVPPVKPTAVQEKVAKTEEPKAAKKTAANTWHAQLLSSASKAKVESSWKQIAKKQAALLSDMPYQIVSATIPGKGTFWRLQVGEFSTKEQVVNLCEKLKKKKQECIPVK
ncbi:MAG: SPOR domain-containing protein [Alphaproteobacteria bacterium]|nr:SPOR domain-containing protein [Alphaproteobacteria bacterium]